MPSSETIVDQPGFREALQAHERAERINTGRVAAAGGVSNAGRVVLDYFVYRQDIRYFFFLRLLCRRSRGIVVLHVLPAAQRYYSFWDCRSLWFRGVHRADDFSGRSCFPYYAAEPILLAVSVVVRWSVRESIIASLSVMRCIRWPAIRRLLFGTSGCLQQFLFPFAGGHHRRDWKLFL